MKKSTETKLKLHRETLRQMEEQLDTVVGGVTAGPICNSKIETVCCPNSRLC
ncbi:MAG TPA: hypothetical protein VGS07_30515 [Thermoanaerobaculia bacterium]|jgi:hypothetical protein|nr:hypothetical protein [Thermoanaerobaculia bacterium]